MPPITILGRPQQAQHTSGPRRPTDEEYINRSLLDSLDAQADAEPHSSDSEAPPSSGTDIGSPPSSGVASPPIPFSLGNLTRTQSPPGLVKPQQHAIDAYVQHHPNLKGQLYTNNMHSASDLTSTLTAETPKAYDSLTGLSSPTFRGTYGSFNGTRARQGSSAFTRSGEPFGSFYPASESSFLPMGLPTQPPQPSQVHVPTPQRAHQFEGIARPYEHMATSPPISGQGPYGGVDPFASAVMQGHHGINKPGLPPGPRGQQQQQAGVGTGFHSQTAPPMSVMSQTPFGPHLPAGGMGVSGGPPPGIVTAPPLAAVTSTGSTTSQEEISTIFVVGFPDDMSEREFQNMFTFSPGFEAATLKIPFKDSSAYGSAPANGTRINGLGQGHGGSHDPYNLVTVNQGGVLVDNGRDGGGPTTAWTVPHDNDASHFGGGASSQNMPPRKQIIGFARFRTRQEALEAREVLQGRRVDAEKGAVLKAEMAKKNLHTKRGVGQSGATAATLGNGPVTHDSIANIPGLIHHPSAAAPLPVGGEPLSQREKELGAIGAMGFGPFSRRDPRMSESEDEAPSRPPMHGQFVPSGGTRGARERAEDAAERERQFNRSRREKEMLRNANSSAFDAFHSVPQHVAARGTGANSLLAAQAMEDSTSSGFRMAPPPSQPPGLERIIVGSSGIPWSGGGIRKVPASLNGLPNHDFARAAYQSQPPHITETGHGSPTHEHEYGSGPPSTTSQDGFDSDTSCNADAGLSDGGASVPMASPFGTRDGSLAFRARALSPGAESQYGMHPSHYSQPTSSASSSASGGLPHRHAVEELASSMVAPLATAPGQGEISPQMTSPVSNSSSNGPNGTVAVSKANVADQNPPINTLYVGNLPSSPHLQYSNQLEESLKTLFQRCQGFRKLCFRQKANGPMCFVEFDDVSFATKALNDLYGNTLDGLVKNGGIRLSYSKNPLGVRTPTGASGNHSGHPAGDYVEGADPIPSSGRREVTSPTSGYHYSLSPPPPRFSSSPGAAFGGSGPVSSTAFPRANPQGYSLPPNSTTIGSNSANTFSPFGLPSPARMGEPTAAAAAVASDEHLVRSLPLTT